MDIQEYINNPVVHQQKWHSKKSSEFKKKYLRAKIIIIACSALASVSIFIFTICKHDAWLILSFLLNVGASFTGAILLLTRWDKLWVQYRDISEILKSKKRLYEMGQYADDSIFIQDIENILTSEHNKWKTTILKDMADGLPKTTREN